RYTGKTYRLPTARDLEAYRAAETVLEEKRRKLHDAWGIDPVPNEPTPKGGGPGAERAFSVHKYGLTRWGDLFNARQKLALVTGADAVRRAHAEMLRAGYEPEFARAVTTYLAVTFDRLAAALNTLCRWQSAGEKIADVFSRQALPMVWDFAEPNPFGGASRSWDELFTDTINTLTHVSLAPTCESYSHHGTATSLPWPDDFFDAVLTDPPYCLAPGTLILTDRGYVPIEHIQVGDRVLSHKGRWAKVTRLYRRPYRGPILRLKVAHCNQPLLITPEHPVRAIAAAPCPYERRAACSPECADVQQQGRCPHAQFGAYRADWIPAGQLKANDYANL
ncbi:MAG: Hint domain-containing protein, partial [Verrucomicrobiae bacterium]|nr:Hint domain-containing protein [Verrucomicrobiae bacterium]